MFRPLTLIPMRKQKSKSRVLTPLGTTRGKELVDHDLGYIHEVAKLGLPDNHVGIGAD